MDSSARMMWIPAAVGSSEGEGRWFPDGSGCARCRLDVLKRMQTAKETGPPRRNREQKGNREKKKPKKDKPKGAPAVSSFGAQFNKPAGSLFPR